ncbi:MAG: hypothetical protein H6822_25160 [Planctomycetaceae bacterium]|nr:hypothetical protein [Planctomycetales bacterium]MCB9925466.1 hypothetical protein [Planctomycetaceae bacterium]
MLDRRTFLGAAAGGLAATSLSLANDEPKRKRLAIVTTEWRFHSHAWHMGTRFLVGYPINGRWHKPPFDVVSAYVDQFPDGDLSRARSKEFGFPVYKTIAEALRCGGKELAVDAVLCIGEHGNYPNNEFGQKLYPRYEFFKDVVKVFKEDGRSVPMFNDKHLSWKWSWAKEMVDTSREMGFGYCAGSSLPVTWRMPAIDMPYEADVDELMCVAIGGVDSYDFHALETIQCMAERRKGGETGVAWVESMRGDSVWKAMEGGSFETGSWEPELFHACLSRSQTLAQPPTFSHRYPTPKQIREWAKDPIVYRFQYNDGVKGSMLLMNGLVSDFTFAARIKGKDNPLSTLFYLPPNPNVTYSASLMSKAEETFITGKAPTPIERTLLTSGLVEAGVQSLVKGERIETPYMNVKYNAPRESTFAST